MPRMLCSTLAAALLGCALAACEPTKKSPPPPPTPKTSAASAAG